MGNVNGGFAYQLNSEYCIKVFPLGRVLLELVAMKSGL